MFPKLLVTAAVLSAAPIQAQLAAGPAITTGGEISLSVLQQTPGSTSTLGAGLSGAFRHAGKLNISAGLSYVNDPRGGSFGELGTFGPLNALNIPSGISVGWTAGLGYSEGRQGLYLPVGLNASRDFRVRTATVVPFAEARLIAEQIDAADRYMGTISMAAEVGMELRVGSRWSVRAGFGTLSAGANSAIGVARRM
jgi:hypothetical protein